MLLAVIPEQWSWSIFNDTRPTYRRAESEDAWRRTLAFLREQLELDND